MTHKYPFGALETTDAARYAENKTLYAVLGLGQQSSMEINMRISELKLTSHGTLYFTSTIENGIGWEDGRCHLMDHNIGAHYNNHYLFHDIEDAQAYLSWAKENTTFPKRDGWKNYYG